MLPPSNFSRWTQSFRYPCVVLLVSVISWFQYERYGLSQEGLAYMLLSACLVTASFIDMDHRIIPDSINLFLGITGLIFLFLGWTVSIMEGLLGFATGGGVLLIIGLMSIWFLKKEGMGGGDIKLAAVCGLFMGVERIVVSFFITSYLAFITILILLLTRKLKKGQYIPFGPFLSMGAIIAILYHEDIIYYYYRLILS